ncbi:MAG: DMT family transporter [Burkholderiales bacterium]|nr:DMT family transporter [Burkholderiales bacterium]
MKTIFYSSFLGLFAAFLTVMITAGWQVTTRYGVTTSLDPIDLALLRYGLPGLLLLPLIVRVGPLPKAVNRRLIAIIVLGSGLPFGLLAIVAASHAPVSHMGILLPGGIVLFVALFTTLVLKQSLSPPLKVGIFLIGIGIGILTWGAMTSPTARTLLGDGMFLLAALFWAGYTLALKKTGLTPAQATGVAAFWSLLLVVPVWLVMQDGQLWRASIADLSVQVLSQSLLAGVVAVWSYSVAVRELGAMRTAAIGALIPVFSGIGGHLFLQEPMTSFQIMSALFVVCGVVIASGTVNADHVVSWRRALLRF